jgi:uncharacterized membrane protein
MEAIVLIIIVVFGLPIILSIVALNKVGHLSREVDALRKYLHKLQSQQGQTQSSALASDTAKSQTLSTTPEPASNQNTNKAAETSTIKSQETTKSPERSTRESWAKSVALQSDTPRKRAAKPVAHKTDKPQKPKKSFEEWIGAQGSVWVGGLVLLIGAVFLLRYSIEAGVFTPAMRVSMAGLLGLVLLGAGEWLHRADLKNSLSGRGAAIAKSIKEKAYIPTLLTAIGLFTLYGTLYAAFALYGFLGSVPAFAGLGLISLFALALSYRHGAVLAAIGLVGSLVTPLLIQTDDPNIYMLYGYLLAVSAASLWVAKARQWGWLNVSTLFGLLFWSFMSFEAVESLSTLPVWYAFLGLGLGLNVFIAERAALQNGLPPKLHDITHNNLTSYLWAGGAALLSFAAWTDNVTSQPHAVAILATIAALMGAAWAFKKQPWLTVIGAFLGLVVLFQMNLTVFGLTGMTVIGIVISLALIAFSILRRLASEKENKELLIWAGLSAAYPIVLWSILYERFILSEPSLFAGLMAGTCLVLVGLSYGLYKNQRFTKSVAGFYAIGAATAYILASFMGLERMGETLSLMAGLALVVCLAWSLRETLLRLMVPVFALLSLAHSLLIRIADGDVRETLIFNELVLYFAVPAILCGIGAWLLSASKRDLASEGLKALTLTFSALFVIFQIRHIMNGGDVLAARLSFDELSLQVLTGLSFTLGATRLTPHKWDPKGDLHTRLLPTLAMVVSGVSLLLFVFGLCLSLSPLFNGDERVSGNIILNSLVLGYFLPALFLGFIARALQQRRPEIYIRILGGLALLSLIFFATGIVRFGFSGDMISIFETPPKGYELYAISAVWLILGIVFLVAGLRGDRKDLRVASAVLIVLTVLKAFFVDMAGLEGVLRAVSFVVLGLILIVIGRIYQKILFSKSD